MIEVKRGVINVVYIDRLYCGIESYPVRIDIDNDIVKLNRKELDNKSRKNVAKGLRKLFPAKRIRNVSIENIELTMKDMLIIEFNNPVFKHSYKNLRLYTRI